MYRLETDGIFLIIIGFLCKNDVLKENDENDVKAGENK